MVDVCQLAVGCLRKVKPQKHEPDLQLQIEILSDLGAKKLTNNAAGLIPRKVIFFFFLKSVCESPLKPTFLGMPVSANFQTFCLQASNRGLNFAVAQVIICAGLYPGPELRNRLTLSH